MFGNHWLNFKALAVGVMSLSTAHIAFAQGASPSTDASLGFVPGQVVVKLKASAQRGAATAGQVAPPASDVIDVLAQKHKALGAKKLFATVGHAGAGVAPPAAAAATKSRPDNIFVLDFDEDVDVEALVNALRVDANVAYAEPNYIYTTSFTPNDPYFSSSGSWGNAYDDLYGLKLMGMEAAWDITQGDQMIVAVVDTGLDFTHADIQGNYWINPGEIANNGIDDDNNGFVDDVNGYDFIGASISNPNQPGANPDNDPTDGNGHGTHVSGTIAARGNNSLGIIGVAPQAKIMAVKGLDDGGSGLSTTLAGALIYAADNGAKVINNSWGGYGDSSLINEAVEYAYAQGAVVIAAAGNENNPAAWPHPSKHPKVISVAALTPNDQDAYFSNWGAKIDVGAPGTNILSLLAVNSGFEARGQRIIGQHYLEIDGTSMAAPHVAGLAALLLAQNPALTQEQVRHILTQTADDVMNSGWDVDSGSGRINAQAALSYSGTAPDFFVSFTSPQAWSANGHSFALRGTISGSDFDHYEVAYARYTPDQALTFNTITTGTTAGENQLLTEWQTTTLPSDLYILRLRAFNSAGRFNEARLMVRVDNDLKPGWAKPVSENGHAFGIWFDRAMAFDDLDNDGQKEVITYGDFTVNVWDANGVPRAGFPVTLDTPVLAGPTIVDLDNDGFKEIVVSVWTDTGDAGPVWAFRHDGSVMPGFPAGRPAQVQVATDFYRQAPVVAADLEGDGQVELMYTIKFQQPDQNNYRNGQTWIGVLNADGSFKSGYPQLLDQYYAYDATQMAVLDIDRDGSQEILVNAGSPPEPSGYSPYRYLRIYGANGSIERELTFNDKLWHFRDFHVADFNRDGDYEIFFSASVRVTSPGESSGQGYMVDRHGNFLPGWPVQYDGSVDTQNGTVVINLDADPELEVVEILDRQVMMAFNVDGSSVSGFPTAVVNEGFSNAFVTANMADVSGTALIGNDTNWSGGLRVYNNQGEEVTAWRKSTSAGFSTPVVADLDNDGRLEIGINGLDGRVYIWQADTPSGVEATTEWPTLWANNQRTNYVPTDIEPEFDSTFPQVYFRGTPNNFASTAMTLVDDYLWEIEVEQGAGTNLRFKLDINGDWSHNYGDTNGDGIAERSGADIPLQQGRFRITFNDQTLAYTITNLNQSTWQRTVIFIYGTTVSGQDMFIRGGIDHNYANTVLGRNCSSSNFECAIPIRHLNLLNATTTPWKANDNYLDWYGPETGQSTQSMGTPLDWTTNVWPSSWGTKRTVAVDGYGETPLNRWGQHYWMLDVEMDCSKTVDGWFELKSFISNGPGWEGDVNQPGRPYVSGNHFAQCGKLNAFRRGESSAVTIEDL